MMRVTKESPFSMNEASRTQAASPGLLAQIKPLIRTMRPNQYTKNVFVWAALLFDRKLFVIQPFLRTLITFILFCLISSAVYIINDLVDVEKDRLHPTKCKRAIASGALSPRVAGVAAALIVLLCLPVAIWLDSGLVLILYGYLGLMIAYSFWLKNMVIVDVLTIAVGFVLRVAAGVVVVDANNFSPWIYVCMTLLALFLALGKRRQEIVLMKDDGGSTRTILQEYNLRFLDEMLALVTSTTVMAYSLYTFSAPNLPPDHLMMLTIPFVLYGLFRYLYLIHVRGETDPPDAVALKDRPLQFDLLLFGAVVIVLFYLIGKPIA
jgi:4-hydroxybenzoate polyprenyltransferase